MMVPYLISPHKGRWHLRCAETGKPLMDFETREQALKQCNYLLGRLSGEVRILDAHGSVAEVRKYPENGQVRRL
jgi:hypothetical protein